MLNRRKHQSEQGVQGEMWTPSIDLTQVLSGLSLADSESFLSALQEKSYPAGSFVYSPGEKQGGIYLLKRGQVAEFRLTQEGSRLPMGRILPVQFFGISSVDGRYCCFAEVMEESVVGFLSFEELGRLFLSYPPVAINLVRWLAGRLGELEGRFQLFAFGGLRARVAAALMELTSRLGPRLTGVTHEALAEWAGGSRPRVSQILKELERAGLVRLSRSEVLVHSPSALQKWAKEATAEFSDEMPAT